MMTTLDDVYSHYLFLHIIPRNAFIPWRQVKIICLCNLIQLAFIQGTYQANKYANELHNISVGYRVQPAEERIKHSDAGGDYDGNLGVQF